ncbi:unnamed protein product [Rhizophagus irregularis]|uniref:Uncharacterized protein n=1 Tax=Rhizophagus irregularis TaxID=588596 RepID=A0A915ZN09_9GLOM|nr:unnamed protein product [Rhizophagus irregularis]
MNSARTYIILIRNPPDKRRIYRQLALWTTQIQEHIQSDFHTELEELKGYVLGFYFADIFSVQNFFFCSLGPWIFLL